MVAKMKDVEPSRADGTHSFTITLVRHGETDENARSTIQGQMDTHLNEAGRHQALSLASTFPIRSFSLLYSSDLARAYETALTLLLRSPESTPEMANQTTIQTDTRLRARNFGVLEGKPVDRLLFEALGQGAGKTVTDFTPQHGESALEVQARVHDFIESRLLPEVEAVSASGPCPNVLVVTHAVVISEMLAYLGSFKEDSFNGGGVKSDQTMRTPNTSVSTFRVHYEVASKTFPTSKKGRRRITGAECFQSHGTGHLLA